jgi:P4 family phage/plasmid primase-like protien
LFSSFLSGKTGHEKFHIWTGCGGNGKSKIIELFRMAFGDYCTTLPITLITEKRSRAEGANPALAKTKGKRFAALQEPENDEKINVGLMKEITGGDTIEARGLYKDPIEFKPQFKLVLTCNDLPTVNANDRGTWRRIRLVEFISKFVEDPNTDPKAYEFLIDEELDEKLTTWKEAFMYRLLEEHKQYRLYGITEPEEVKLSTKQYQNESDHFVQFINENIVESDEFIGQELKLDDIYFVYQEWYKQSKGHNAKIPPRRDLQKNIEKKYGKCTQKRSWTGIAFKHIKNQETDDLDSGL